MQHQHQHIIKAPPPCNSHPAPFITTCTALLPFPFGIHIYNEIPHPVMRPPPARHQEEQWALTVSTRHRRGERRTAKVTETVSRTGPRVSRVLRVLEAAESRLEAHGTQYCRKARFVRGRRGAAQKSPGQRQDERDGLRLGTLPPIVQPTTRHLGSGWSPYHAACPQAIPHRNEHPRGT